MTGLNITLARFFGLSLAIHAGVFGYLMLLQKLHLRPRTEPSPIAVSLLPPGQKESATAAPAAATKPSQTLAPIAKKDSPSASKAMSPRHADKTGEQVRSVSPEKNAATVGKMSPAERILDDKLAGLPVPTPAAPQRELPIEKSVVGERRLPTLKELLPPITYSSGGGTGNAPVSLNTKDPAYVSYFNRIKQAIEINWEYPELAKRYGLQGKLAVEFTVGADGHLEQLRITRSSGSQLLDDEAIRAIKAAAPFPRIPPWIKGSQLPISASMEYTDSRLNYR